MNITSPDQIVFVRHAESEGNVISIDQRAAFEKPSWDYDITPMGVKQAEITGEYLKERFGDRYFDVFQTSYFTRASRTLEVMFPGQHHIEDSRLAEAQRGIYHTMTKTEITQVFPMEIARKDREDLYHYRPWGGENWPDVEQRIHSWIDSINRTCTRKRILVVMHGHWMLLFQKIIEGFSVKEALERYHRKPDTGRKQRTMYENTEVLVYDRFDNELFLKEEGIVPWRGKL